MLPLLQLDPMSLAVWLQPDRFGEGPVGDATRAALHAAWQGDDFPAAIHAHATTQDEAEQAAWFGSCMWHEKRHFFDICLTSFGAWRQRHMFVVAGNSYSLQGSLHRLGQPVYFPHTVYRDALCRGPLKIGDPPGSVEAIARDIYKRKKAMAEEAAPVRSGELELTIGGEAQMEALALISQIHGLARRYGMEPAAQLNERFVNPLERTGVYRWVEALAGALGCAEEGADGKLRLDYELASALLVAGLCGRWLGAGREPSVVSPRERLGRLMAELGPRPGRVGMTTDECAVLVDAAARRIWGRGLWQELDADVEAAEAVGATLRSQIGVEPLCDAFDATLKLRRRMLEAVKAEGPAAMSPRAFAASWEDRLLPLLVHVHPGGAIWDPPNQPTVEYGGALQRENGEVVDAWGWGWRVEPEDEVTDRFALDVDAARYLLTQAAPLAKLALNGRGHDLMLEQELEDELGRLASAGLDCRIHPDFAASPDRPRTAREQALRSYAKILRHDSFQCDITGDSIGVDEGVLLRAGEFRRSPLLARFRDAVGDAAAADHFLRRNWSDWIVRADLLQ